MLNMYHRLTMALWCPLKSSEGSLPCGPCGSPRPPLRLQALINRSGPTTLKCSNRDACPSGKQNTPNDVPIQKGFASLSSYEVRGATFAACRGTRARTLKREALPEIRIEKSLRKTHTLQSTLSLCPSSLHFLVFGTGTHSRDLYGSMRFLCYRCKETWLSSA